MPRPAQFCPVTELIVTGHEGPGRAGFRRHFTFVSRRDSHPANLTVNHPLRQDKRPDYDGTVPGDRETGDECIAGRVELGI